MKFNCLKVLGLWEEVWDLLWVGANASWEVIGLNQATGIAGVVMRHCCVQGVNSACGEVLTMSLPWPNLKAVMGYHG